MQPDVFNDGTLSFQLAANASGLSQVRVTAIDNGATNNTSVPQTFNILVTEINDPPLISLATDVIVAESQEVTIPNFFTNLDPIETGQTITPQFNYTGDPIFHITPSLDAGQTDLHFRLHDSASGTATVTFTATDNGGTANGGDNDTSVTFTITSS
ncbi:MAG: hypothetical protein AAF483_11150, partial [Planctomycetota bacterium]